MDATDRLKELGVTLPIDTVVQIVQRLGEGAGAKTLERKGLGARNTIKKIRDLKAAGKLAFLEAWQPESRSPGPLPPGDLLGEISRINRAKVVKRYLRRLDEDARVIGQAVRLVRVLDDEYDLDEDAIVIESIFRQDAHLARLAAQFENACRSKDREEAIGIAEQMRREFERWTGV